MVQTMLESKKGMDSQVKLLQIFATVAKPLLVKSRTDSDAKEALNALDTGRALMESAIKHADSVFVDREEAAAKRLAPQAPPAPPVGRKPGKSS